MSDLSVQLARFLKLEPIRDSVSFRVVSTTDEGKYRRSLIEYDDQEGAVIPAFLLEPSGSGPFPAVLIHHQHNGERHFGKSEVCGLAGNPLQAFGPALAERGIVVLAPAFQRNDLPLDQRRFAYEKGSP